MKTTLIIMMSIIFATALYGEALIPLSVDTEKELYFYIQPESEIKTFSTLGEYETHYIIKNIYIDISAKFSLTFSVITDDVDDPYFKWSIPNCVLAIYNEDKVCIGSFVLMDYYDPLPKLESYQSVRVSDQEVMFQYNDSMDILLTHFSSGKRLRPKYFSVIFIGCGAG